jgi:maltooligosyltrehalose trehalohydrolase
MPFGAQLLEDGRVRFRVWAPAVRRLELGLEDAADRRWFPMTPQPGGWFGCVTEQAGAGSRYRIRLEDGMQVPDPASRYQPDGVHGPSEVVDPRAFDWSDDGWCGRPWEESVLYELHVGSYTPQGTLAAARERLGYLAGLGITAIELMPLGAFPGTRDWGYNGVLPYAPHHGYGRPEDLKALVQEAHAHGLMVLLDVVYNHFGPEGNYLHCYAPAFFTERHQTPWGAGLNFDGPDNRTVRDFFLHNALYWLEEYNLDGLRLDAVHAIQDDSRPDILEELAAAVQAGPGRHRQVHLVLENDDNAARYLLRADDGRARGYAAQWNDDFHHACHVLLTGETHGYYRDYAADPLAHLARCLCEGFAYQGEPSVYRQHRPRGEPSGHLPPAAFVTFLQNHDQIGNRACGERLSRLAPPEAIYAVTALLLLAPSPPLLFMGQEWGARQPFPYFCDFGSGLAAAVTEGRRREFADFPAFREPAARARIPDPLAAETFRTAVLDWTQAETATGRDWLALHRRLLRVRHDWQVYRYREAPHTQWRRLDARALQVSWHWEGEARLTLLANLDAAPSSGAPRPPGACGYATHAALGRDPGTLPAWALAWYLERRPAPEPGTS